MNKEFNKYARLEHGISSMTLHRYESVLDGYINPTIIEERKLNVASMDVFSRLMMDRIIFLGVPIDDDVANIIQAQLLFLASTDNTSDISIYLNTPGGQVSSGLGIYDNIGQICKNGVSIPLSGFINATVSSALEYKNEGLVLGIGSNIFKLSGSVLAIGSTTAILVATIRYIFWLIR